MKLRHVVALALVLSTACGPDMKAIDAANERAEAAAFRAETAASVAEAASAGTYNSCYRSNRTVISVEQSVNEVTEYIGRFEAWEILRKMPQHREPSAPKPGTILPDGSIAATLLEALTVSPRAYDASKITDPRDREDDEHATAVMACHPELDSLPGFVGKSVGSDFIGNTKTKDGREATIIFITIDDTDKKNGAAILKHARETAPAMIDDVPVRVMGIPVLEPENVRLLPNAPQPAQSADE